MDYVSIDILSGIAERWGEMPKKQIAKELKLSLKDLNDYAYRMANGAYGDEFELPQTKKYGPYDERQDIDIKVGKKVYPIRVPKCDWPKKKADIQEEIEDTLSVVTSDVLRAAMHHPEDYGWLIVRISGYNAYFVDLNKDMQIELIERTEFATH